MIEIIFQYFHINVTWLTWPIKRPFTFYLGPLIEFQPSNEKQASQSRGKGPSTQTKALAKACMQTRRFNKNRNILEKKHTLNQLNIVVNRGESEKNRHKKFNVGPKVRSRLQGKNFSSQKCGSITIWTCMSNVKQSLFSYQ